MPLSKNINQYQDVRRILEQAVKMGGGNYMLATEKKANQWRQRAYQYRKLLQEQLAQQNLVPGFTPSTPFDMMVLGVEGKMVTIRFREEEGQLLSLTGDKVEITDPSPEEDDDLLREAQALVERHGDGD